MSAKQSQIKQNPVDLDRSEVLSKGLISSADVRPEMVERARALVGSSDYPSVQTLRFVATVLADQIDLED